MAFKITKHTIEMRNANTEELVGSHQLFSGAILMLRARIKALNMNFLAMNYPNVPAAITERAHWWVDNIDMVEIDVGEDGVVMIADIRPDMDYYRIEEI